MLRNSTKVSIDFWTVFQIHFLKSKITLKYTFESSTEQEEQKKIQRLSFSKLVSSLKNYICQAEELMTYFGSGGPSDSGFMDSLHNDLNTRKASFCKMWENLAPGEGPEEFPDS